MLVIVKKSLCIGGKAMVIGNTNDDDYERDLDNILENMEGDDYIQCEASEEEMAEWDKNFVDWVLVCDSEDESDRYLIYVEEQ